MTATGNYVVEADISNFPSEYSTAQKQDVIDRCEDLVEHITKDYFYTKSFSITVDGNGKNKIFPSFVPDILSITSIKLSDVTLDDDLYAFDKDCIFRAALATAQCQAIEGITLTGTDPVSIELTAHGFITGETARLVSVLGITPSLNGEYVITRTNADNFTLNGTDSSDYTGTFTSGTVCFATLAELHYLTGEGGNGLFPKGTRNVEIVGTYGWSSCPAIIKRVTIILCLAENDPTLYPEYDSSLSSESLGDYSYTLADSKAEVTGIDKVDKLLKHYIRKKCMLGAI